MQASHAAGGAEFRNDINGLRAWAVVSVVLYHFGLPGFGGGFVGVDVFFVISGLLMTSIVARGLEGGRFSVWDFYLARGRRIIPALLALCASLLGLGWFFLPVTDYRQLGSHVATSASFVSNMKYWLESGYFDASSHEKWLLHTWSLAVEWQFYIVLPLAFLVLWRVRHGRKTFIWATALGLLASLALCIALTPTKPTGAFFLLPTRAWEMLAGGLLYLLSHPWRPDVKVARILEAAGLLLIVGSVVGLNAHMAWPGWRAALPVIGGVAVLLAARNGSFWTGNRAAQWLGTRSYSLYLWHWPLVVALEYAHLQSSPVAIALALAFTAALGHLSYRWVEIPTRVTLSNRSRTSQLVSLGVGTVLLCCLGAAIFLAQGIKGRMPSAIDVVSAEARNGNPRKGACHPSSGIASPSCEYGNGLLGAIVLGDSHGDAVVTAVAASAEATQTKVMQWTYSACPILRGVKNAIESNSRCGQFVDWAFQQLETLPSDVPVIIVGRHGQYLFGKNEEGADQGIPLVYFTRRYETSEPAFQAEYAQHLVSTACELAKTRPVYLVRPIPELGVHVPNTARAMVFGKTPKVGLRLTDYHQRNAVVWAAQDQAQEQCGAKILDPLPYLCADGVCNGLKDGRPMYFDDDHLSEFGNRLLVPMFATVFQQSRRTGNK